MTLENKTCLLLSRCEFACLSAFLKLPKKELQEADSKRRLLYYMICLTLRRGERCFEIGVTLGQ